MRGALCNRNIRSSDFVLCLSSMQFKNEHVNASDVDNVDLFFALELASLGLSFNCLFAEKLSTAKTSSNNRSTLVVEAVPELRKI
jgi:hypothetical protein